MAQEDYQKLLEDNQSLSEELDQALTDLKRARTDSRAQEQVGGRRALLLKRQGRWYYRHKYTHARPAYAYSDRQALKIL